MNMTFFDLEFTRTGRPYDAAQTQRILHEVPDLTDLIVISHGWSNDKAEAKSLYDKFFESMHSVIESKIVSGLGTRKLGAVCIYWPSKRYADDDLIPGDGAASALQPNTDALMRLLERMKEDPPRLPDSASPSPPAMDEDSIAAMRRVHLDEARRLVPELEHNAEARRNFLFLLRAIVDPSDANYDDGSVGFFERDAEELFQNLKKPVNAPLGASAGGATTARTEGAAGLVDLIEGMTAAARRLVNYTTYYDMKQRAGVVGRAGLAQMLLRIRDRKPDLRLHLVGHSFGGLLVTAAAHALPQNTPDVTLSLLQAAYSHNGLARNYDGKQHDGAFRKLLAVRSASGPIIITHTKNDRAVGIAYPLASRFSRDEAAALGDENDPYGGMGRNGARHTPEASTGTLEAVGYPYVFATAKVYNLRADRFITGHGDVTGVQVAYAVLYAMRSLGTAASIAASEIQVGDRFARVTAPRELNDEDKRRKWGLPPLSDTTARGQYIVELNAQHTGGLPAAADAFLVLCKDLAEDIMKKPADGQLDLRPLPIAKSYYRCLFTEAEWRGIIKADESKRPNDRAIYRLWPDFPVVAHTDHSMATIKADAARRSFAAEGAGIIWAVIDSGIQADHPHFGPALADDDAFDKMGDKDQAAERKKRAAHALQADEVRDLHRCFANVFEDRGGIPFDTGPLESPDTQLRRDLEQSASPDQEHRKHLVNQHRQHALHDDFGHGTHVAGIIAGEAPRSKDIRICALQREYKIDSDGYKVTQSFEERPVATSNGLRAEAEADGQPLRGVAPRCKLVSLRVLDQNGRGRASQVIQALEYIRDSLNDNPKLLRVHGVNLSVGYEFDAEMFACGQSPLCNEVDRLVQEGVVVVAAAGNTGYGTIAASVGTSKVGLSNTINDPGNAALAITVGATHRDMPHLYGVSYFSSKGPTGDGRLKPDLIAPGERITSCAAGTKLKEARALDGGDRSIAYYVDDSGTSMAAPHVSGAIAAFLSIRREFIGKPLEVKRIFSESATPLGRERYFEGHGLVDLMRAIQSV